MDFVVVYLKEVQEHVIVPEDYIHDLNIKKLKNYGRNTNQDFLVFWSSECIEGLFYPMPKCNAEYSNVFPANGDAWYKGRTLYFTNDIEEARQFRDRKRKIMPAVYNHARLHETPIPDLVIVSNQQNVSNSSVSSDLNEGDPLETSVNSISSNTVESFAKNSTACETTTDLINFSNENVNVSLVEPQLELSNTSENEYGSLQQSSHTIEPTASISSDILNKSTSKHINENSDLSLSVATGLSNSLEQLGIQTNLNSSMQENQSVVVMYESSNPNNIIGIAIKDETPFMPLNNVDSEAAESVFHQSFENCTDTDDDVMICKHEEIPMPLCERVQLDFEVKNNDIVSGSMAYAKNDDSDRFYMVTEGNTWKGITLTKRVVNGLIYWNSENRRNSIEYDKRFLKVAIVSCIGVDNVKDNKIDGLYVKFIKDLFAVRVNEESERSKTFDELLNSCVADIRINKFD